MLDLSPEQQRIQALVAESKRRQNTFDLLLEKSFPEQRAFVLDRSPRKSALTTRRAGKSMALAISYFEADLRHPGSNFLYVGVTSDVAFKIIWKDCLDVIGRGIGQKLTKVDQRKEITFPSGSKLYIIGIDANEDDKKKAFGVKYSLVCIDEAATYKVNIKEFVEDVIEPTISDFNDGQVVLAGMPNNMTHSYFYDVTTEKVKGWSLHKWSALQNPYMRANFIKKIEFLKKQNPNIINTPGFKQMYLGEWAIEEDKLVYKFSDERNTYEALPTSRYPYHFVLGIDLGWDDSTAFVVNAYRDYDPCTYVVHAYKRAGMQLKEVSEYILNMHKVYNFDRMIIDNASKQAVEDIKQRIAMPLEPAEKTGKADFIGILNNDMILGNIKLHTEDCKELIKEMRSLTWDTKGLLKGRRQEDAKAENHLCDAFLYAWRYCFSWVDRGVEPNPLDIEAKIETQIEEEVLSERVDNSEWELYGREIDEADLFY